MGFSTGNPIPEEYAKLKGLLDRLNEVKKRLAQERG
jgi:hypothetical protein